MATDRHASPTDYGPAGVLVGVGGVERRDRNEDHGSALGSGSADHAGGAAGEPCHWLARAFGGRRVAFIPANVSGPTPVSGHVSGQTRIKQFASMRPQSWLGVKAK